MTTTVAPAPLPEWFVKEAAAVGYESGESLMAELAAWRHPDTDIVVARDRLVGSKDLTIRALTSLVAFEGLPDGPLTDLGITGGHLDAAWGLYLASPADVLETAQLTADVGVLLPVGDRPEWQPVLALGAASNMFGPPPGGRIDQPGFGEGVRTDELAELARRYGEAIDQGSDTTGAFLTALDVVRAGPSPTTIQEAADYWAGLDNNTWRLVGLQLQNGQMYQSTMGALGLPISFVSEPTSYPINRSVLDDPIALTPSGLTCSGGACTFQAVSATTALECSLIGTVSLQLESLCEDASSFSSYGCANVISEFTCLEGELGPHDLSLFDTAEIDGQSLLCRFSFCWTRSQVATEFPSAEFASYVCWSLPGENCRPLL